MNITVEVNDELLAKARKYSELQDDAELVHRALKAFVEREAARRLASMGGCDPNAKAPPR